MVSGDGAKVYRERTISPTPRRSGGGLHPDLRGRKWARFEVWDVATDGAFTQPVWITGS